MYKAAVILVFVTSITLYYGCVPKKEISQDEPTSQIGSSDINTSDGTGLFDDTGNGVFGREIIYRDVASAKAALTVSGTCAVKICVNQAGIVTFADIFESQTTIKDAKVLKAYLKAARNYKFQKDLNAPKEQCGKIVFKAVTTIKNKYR